MSAPVFLAEPGTLSALQTGDTYLLDGEEGRHAAVVQRRGPGEVVEVVDGAGVRLRGEVLSNDDGALLLTIQTVNTEPTEPFQFTLVQALAKNDRDEQAIEAATELGVADVIPWQSQRAGVVWRGNRAEKSRQRWINTGRHAAKQSRRATVPEVGSLQTTTHLAGAIKAAVAQGTNVLVLHEEAATGLSEVIRALSAAPAPCAVWLVVGPEGGISSDEVTKLTSAGAQTVRLGRNVLRASSAGPVALAALQSGLGLWDQP